MVKSKKVLNHCTLIIMIVIGWSSQLSYGMSSISTIKVTTFVLFRILSSVKSSVRSINCHRDYFPGFHLGDTSLG